MSKQPCKVEAVTKHEIVRRIAQKSGYPIYQCSEIWEAFVEAIQDVLEEGRAVVFKKLGRLEPHTKKERKLYHLTPDVEGGIKLDENGERMSYIFPPVNIIKFHTANIMKQRMNPGIYSDETASTEYDD